MPPQQRDNTTSLKMHETNSYPTNGMVVVVDPYSTGCLVAEEIAKRGFDIVELWTTGFAEEMKKHVPKSVGELQWYAVVDQAPTLAEMEKILRQLAAERETELIACVAGGEAGVDYADALSEYLGLDTNGTDVPNRRDKKIQQELGKCYKMAEGYLFWVTTMD